ncbi:glycosyltransferase family A protein [Plantibacter sp. YIM 135347]|uniref:glycosyltransferase family A protein n=1 Tax=Plantibacter sp. YIM 135347 TaxID=3423919 RepID=UPI003D347AB0
MTVTVDVVVPVKNDTELLERCLTSILAQVVQPATVIIVDNGSRDRPAVQALAAAHGAVLLDEQAPGIPAASATGFDHVTAQIIARLDADCIAPPDWIAHILRAFADDSALVAVTGPAQFIDGPRLLRVPLAKLYLGAYRGFAGAALARVPLFGSNYAPRARSASPRVHRSRDVR